MQCLSKMVKYLDLQNSANVTMWELWSNVMLLWIVSRRQGNVKCASQTRGWVPSLGLPTEIKDSSRGLVHNLKIIFSLTCLHVLSLYSDENLKLAPCKTSFPSFYIKIFSSIWYHDVDKININNSGLSFISDGRPRRGPWPGVWFAHFILPHLWVCRHPQHNVT